MTYVFWLALIIFIATLCGVYYRILSAYLDLSVSGETESGHDFLSFLTLVGFSYFQLVGHN